MADITVNQGAIYGKTHAAVAGAVGDTAPGKAVIRRSDFDDEAKSYYMLWLRAKRVLTSGVDPEDITETQARTLREWMGHAETQRLADASDSEVRAALSGLLLQ